MVRYCIMSQSDSTFPTFQLREDEIRSFLRQAPAKRFASRGFFFNAALGLTAMAAIFVFLNLGSFLRIHDQAAAAQQYVAEPVPNPITPIPGLAPVTKQAVIATPAPTPVPSALTIPDNTVSYSDLGVSAPVQWDTPFLDAPMQKALETGVIHIAGTAKPGQNGMAIITGHSSNYYWDKGAFNNVFAPLTKAKAGQTIDLAYNGAQYSYTVTKIYEVKPTQLDVLQAGSKPGLRLITCTPVGTSLRRLVVEAEQTSPDPALATAFTQSVATGALPGDK